MLVGSICSGISADAVAWSRLGWSHLWFTEIDPFCNAVLEHHYPRVPNYGDFTTARLIRPDLLIASTPCQDFSIAGDRAGMDGARGKLTVRLFDVLSSLRSRWVVFENVPGILSIDRGRAFYYFLRSLGECGYGFAYRVLNAQYFGVPQRRRRVFVIGYLGDWRYPAAVLFERSSLQGDTKTRGNPREDVTPTLAARFDGTGTDFLVSGGFVAAYGGNNCSGELEVATACRAKGGTGHGDFESETFLVDEHLVPRRFTPRECERLQGFPDDYTLVPYRGKLARDGPRYRAIGNSIAVPVLRWIGERIQLVESMKGR